MRFGVLGSRYARMAGQRRRNSGEMRNNFDSGQQKQIIKMTRGVRRERVARFGGINPSQGRNYSPIVGLIPSKRTL